jgi:flagellar basal body rod protein FlgG
MIDLMIARNQVEASAKVVKTMDETLGTIIDELA